MSIITIGCKSRFTSTSDSTGPRRHEFADPSTESDDDVTHGVSDTARMHTKPAADTVSLIRDTVSVKKDSLKASH